MKVRTRDQVGPRFSEGSRLLWRVLKSKSWTQAQLRDDIGASTGIVHRWLYGDTCPSLGWGVLLETRYGIPVGAWNRKSSRPFNPLLAA